MRWAHQVESRDEVFRAISRVGTLEAGRRYVWRGVASRHFSVRSSLLRDLARSDGPVPSETTVRKREGEIIAIARKWGVGIEQGTVGTDLHLLALLQHHGLPTRLLDVTCNPTTALWFACQRAPGVRDAAGLLLAFDVTSIPELPTIDVGPATWAGVGDPFGAGLAAALERSATDLQPFLVRPSLPDPRMTAQEGLFIAGVTPTRPSIAGVESFPFQGVEPAAGALEALFSPDERRPGRPQRLAFLALVIPSRLKERIRNSLRDTYNRRRSVLFPDIAGLAEAVRLNQVDS
jgi:hypothetical protein